MKQLMFMTGLLLYCVCVYSQNVPPPPKKSMGISPVGITQGNNVVTICFNVADHVTVSIADPDGNTVYRNTVNTSWEPRLVINAARWTGDVYLIRVTGSGGTLVREILYYRE